MTYQGQLQLPGLTLVEELDTRRNDVWRAQRADRADVAVKLLNPAYVAMVPKRFARSDRRLRRLVKQSPGWSPVLDSGTANDGRAFLVTKYVPGGSLADRLEQGPVPWAEAATVVARVAATIGSAHQVGCSFGFIRPSNILIEQPLQPVVSIYGMSTRRFDDGTPEFMAPEVVAGGDPVPASDVYSLALILLSLVLGRGVGYREVTDDVLAELRALAPEQITEAVDYGISPHTRNRYANATKMARALEAAAAEPGSVAFGVAAPLAKEESSVLSEFLTTPFVPGSANEHDSDEHSLDNHDVFAEAAKTRELNPADLETSHFDTGDLDSGDLDTGDIDLTTADDGPDDKVPNVNTWAVKNPVDSEDDTLDFIETGAGSNGNSDSKKSLATSQSEHPTNPPWLDESTDPGDERLGTVTTEIGTLTGPLSDLINPAARGAAPTVDFFSQVAAATGHIDAAKRTRQELEELVDGMAVEASPSAPSGSDATGEMAMPTVDDSDSPDDVADEDEHSGPGGPVAGAAATHVADTIDDNQTDQPIDPDDNGVPFAPRRNLDGLEPATATTAVKPMAPARMDALMDRLSHFFALYRRRAASGAAVLSVAGAVAATVILGVGEFRAGNVVVAEGAPSPTSTTTAENKADSPRRAAPITIDAVPLAPSKRPARVPATPRATVADVASSTTTNQDADSGPTSSDTPTTAPTTTEKRSETTEEETSTTKKRRRRTTTTEDDTSTSRTTAKPTTTVDEPEPSTTARVTTTTTAEEEQTTTTRRRRRRRGGTTTSRPTTSTTTADDDDGGNDDDDDDEDDEEDEDD